jgi:hypothetical protein
MKKVLIVLSSVLLAGCFQPPPSQFAYWSKNGTDREELVRAREECHHINPDGRKDTGSMGRTSDDQDLSVDICLLKKGFKYNSRSLILPNDPCYGWTGELPSCVAYKRGYPMSADELEVMETRVEVSKKWWHWEKMGWRNRDLMPDSKVIEWKKSPYPSDNLPKAEKEQAQKVRDDWQARVWELTSQMGACGYPAVSKVNKEGKTKEVDSLRDSVVKTVSYAELGRMERCMEKAGYEYEYPNLRVCKMYPQIRGCD